VLWVNVVFFAIVAIAFAVAGWRQVTVPVVDGGLSPMEALGLVALKSAEGAVTLGLGLIGTMALFLGIMKIAEAGGLMRVLARLLRPLLHRLFPEVPPDHPAMGAMVMNVAANVLGLSNAATPFGVRAMQELDRLNPCRGVATNAMVLFLALNTANVTLLPTHVMALRTAIGSHDPAAVIPTTLFATLWSTGFAILFAKWGAVWFPVKRLAPEASPRDYPAGEGEAPVVGEAAPPYPLWVSISVAIVCLSFIPLTLLWGRTLSPWIIPSMLVGVLGYGLLRRVPVYEAFVEGAKDGLTVSLRILPYLVAILVAVGMFRESGAMEMLVAPFGQITGTFGLPPEALSMGVLRSLSGSASFGYLAALLKDPAIGPDSYLGVLVSTIYGSSETTFYVLAVYFGAAGVKRIRHALLAGLLADISGMACSVLICRWLYA
jgi:spore maturation protein SpmA/spore maturation protein SpmB